ncbi:uncharacterized protein LOC142555010 isoform X1 [Primulina tabacum]|uniref:uncharacterized protein LOC142555010 isoform X1 n=2 Tax=Primulina tabacum TaxID=48773 RepID=UPI003F5A2997
MGVKASSSRTKAYKKKRNKVSSKFLKKKSRKKESKVLHGRDSVSLSSKSIWSSSSSESDYRTRKNKSKKRCRVDSASSYSDDHSMTSASESLSTHDNKSYKRRKALPRGIKERTRKGFESAESDAESRRRKRSRRHHVVKSSNKPLKMKSRRHFTSSLSSDSESCSACDSRSSNSTGDGKHRRSKMILHKKIKSLRGRESHRAHRKRKARSPSGSSCGTCRDHDVLVDQSDEALGHNINVEQSDEALVPVNNSRRLKSVIAILNRPTDEEENRWEKDPQKEEIICEHDDYPSPKSMDSNEGENKKESNDQSRGVSHKKTVENVESEVILPIKSGNEVYNADDSRSHEVHTNHSENEKGVNVSVNFTTLDGDKTKDGVGNDIELILRQKALENLRRFKGGLKAARKIVNLDTNNENVNESLIKRNDNIEDNYTEPNSFLDQEAKKRSRPTLPLPQVKKDSEHMAIDSPKAPVVLAVNDTNQASGEHSSKEQLDEAKNGSEFDKKTMYVMRGGEMVQVSYKVYIPKRSPALARRQLRR